MDLTALHLSPFAQPCHRRYRDSKSSLSLDNSHLLICKTSPVRIDCGAEIRFSPGKLEKVATNPFVIRFNSVD